MSQVTFSIEDRKRFISQLIHRSETKAIFDKYLSWKAWANTERMINARNTKEMLLARERLLFIKEIQTDANNFVFQELSDAQTKRERDEQEMVEKMAFKVFTSRGE